MSRSFQNPGSLSANARLFSATLLATCTTPGARQGGSGITALNIEFVAKPDAAHKVRGALPAAINGALGDVAGFAGGFVLIANYEARLVTVVTLWTGEDRMQRCNDNLKWVRALLTPYLDRCLRVQTLAAYVPQVEGAAGEIEPVIEAMGAAEDAGIAACAA